MALCLLVASFSYSLENSWNEYWLSGIKYFENEQYSEAKEMFSIVINNMSEEECQQNPDVLIHMASINFRLGNFEDALQQAQELASFYRLSGQERLECGNLIVSVFWEKGMEENAIEAYFNYIASSPIAPKCLFEENKIIIKNVPQCKICEKSAISFLIKNFCEKEDDFQKYANIWVIRVTKKCECVNKKIQMNQHSKLLNDRTKRTPEVVRACCNTCNTLAVGAGVACGRIPHFGCRTFYVLFVETCRQVCESCCYNGGIEEKCWENFSFWKDDFHRQKPGCSIPMS